VSHSGLPTHSQDVAAILKTLFQIVLLLSLLEGGIGLTRWTSLGDLILLALFGEGDESREFVGAGLGELGPELRLEIL
jgi:hypothetical protein